MAKGKGPYKGMIGFSKGSDTSEGAADSFDGDSLCARILKIAQTRGAMGVTRGELVILFGGRYQPSTVGARLTELVLDGKLADSGARRGCAETGRTHSVWVTVPHVPSP